MALKSSPAQVVLGCTQAIHMLPLGIWVWVVMVVGIKKARVGRAGSVILV